MATDDNARAAGGLDDLGRGTLYVSRSSGDDLRADARGDAVLVWSEAGSPQRLAVSVRPPGGAFGAPQSLPDAGAADPSLAVDAAGDYAVAWTDTTRSGELTDYGTPSVAIGTQDTPLGLAIRAPAAQGRDSYAPQAAFLGSLRLAVLWQVKTRPTPFADTGSVVEATLDAGRFGAPRSAGSVEDADDPQVAAMTDQQVLVLSTRTHRFAAQIVTRAGILRSIAPPHGVALQIHGAGAGADRDLASTGRYAIATWAARTGIQASMYHHA
ncbi:MAG TPA: hypothetical protein VIJ51_00835 [Solirubrobacteraceae bacterium]